MVFVEVIRYTANMFIDIIRGKVYDVCLGFFMPAVFTARYYTYDVYLALLSPPLSAVSADWGKSFYFINLIFQITNGQILPLTDMEANESVYQFVLLSLIANLHCGSVLRGGSAFF